MWGELLPIGRHPNTGGYRRSAWSDADLACREWFRAAAQDLGLAVETDRNGNLWAWWGTPGPDAFVTGSHLDSVPDGGPYDGPLGVVSALAAVGLLQDAGVTPARPVAVCCFTDEEGARFGVACIGSRLSAGLLAPDAARGLRDADGTSLAEAMAAAGHDPAGLGRDDAALARIGVFVELHIEQGRELITRAAPLGLASFIWPHGRWRFTFTGAANHAGTTQWADRHDPMLTYAATVLAARESARAAGALATFGKVAVFPNGTNAIPSRVEGWLDARAADQAGLDTVLAELRERADRAAAADGTAVEVTAESLTPLVSFPAEPVRRLAGVLGELPQLATGAGHDAGILSARVPTAMLFVRNPTGVSHAPGEFAEPGDCEAGVLALAAAMTDWVTG
ncbi:MAG TPA: allantoate amidohydrolase [Mycobacteriales bacterium]|nr:allantoate amidohydrolase [Mycobacteriales bacterium]